MITNSLIINVKNLFFLVLFCSFFSINELPINPVYLLGFPLVFLSFYFVRLDSIDKYQFLIYIYFIFALIGFLIGVFEFSDTDPTATLLSSFLYLYCLLLGGQTINLGLLIQKKDRIKIYSSIYNFFIFFMILDFIIRIVLSKNSGTFYDFKWGIFYFDSNFSALVILLFIMFSIFLKVNNIYDIGKLRFLILLFLLLTTFSRAAIFSFVVSYFLLRYAKKIIIYLSFLFSLIVIYIFYKMVLMYLSGESFVDIDGSFNSKFYIISLAIDNYQYLSFSNKLFGIGMANFPYFSDGIFAHNMLVTLIYEFGVYGTLMFLIFIIYSCKLIGKDALYIILPFFIAGFSLFSAFMPFFFVLLACAYVERKSTKGLCNE